MLSPEADSQIELTAHTMHRMALQFCCLLTLTCLFTKLLFIRRPTLIATIFIFKMRLFSLSVDEDTGTRSRHCDCVHIYHGHITTRIHYFNAIHHIALNHRRKPAQKFEGDENWLDSK